MKEDEDLEVVAVCGPAEAQMIEELLKKNDIDSLLQGSGPSNPLPATGDLDEVRVMVRPSDVTKAEELVDAFFSPVGKDELVEDESTLGVEDPDEPGGFKI